MPLSKLTAWASIKEYSTSISQMLQQQPVSKITAIAPLKGYSSLSKIRAPASLKNYSTSLSHQRLQQQPVSKITASASLLSMVTATACFKGYSMSLSQRLQQQSLSQIPERGCRRRLTRHLHCPYSRQGHASCCSSLCGAFALQLWAAFLVSLLRHSADTLPPCLHVGEGLWQGYCFTNFFPIAIQGVSRWKMVSGLTKTPLCFSRTRPKLPKQLCLHVTTQSWYYPNRLIILQPKIQIAFNDTFPRLEALVT